MPAFSPLVWFKQRFARWAFRRTKNSGTLRLGQRTIYIIPSKQGVAFYAVLALMLLGDINYNLSLGYALTFLLATAGSLSMLYTFRNLSQLAIHAGAVEPVFVGEMAEFIFHFDNESSLPRYQLQLNNAGEQRQIFHLPAAQSTVIRLPIPTLQRGWLDSGRLTLSTQFPFGLFHAWTYVHFDAQALVYPSPAAPSPLPWHASSATEGQNITASGEEDFAGLRNYVEGDALAHVAWKALARGQALQVKQFSGIQSETLWLDWAQLPPTSSEQKLQRLTRWVLDADALDAQYGLRLPQQEIPPNIGAAQRANCLRALALFELP